MRTAALAIALLLGSTAPVFAQASSGNADVSHWVCGPGAVSTDIYVTNTSAVDLTVSVSFYGRSGAAVTSGISYANFTGSTLQAGKTGYARITCSTWDYGYATIQWSGNPARHPLLAYGVRSWTTSNGYSEASIIINDGKAF
ncbi:MAG TPA: hypothetical protein VED40_19615 [Azospirillaceae bacterium]|nr:hypothetical protein [Azospirillaceae bacterium]